MSTQNLGVVTAYGYAKEKGYTGTLDQFKQLMYDVSQSQGEINRLDGEITDLKEDIKDNYAKNDGYYDGMTVGNAEQIVGTVFEEDDTAYNYRTTGGSAEVGDRAYVESITGGSLPWNQKVHNGDFAAITGWYVPNAWKGYSISDNVLHLVSNANQPSYSYISHEVGISSGHIYLLSCDVKASKASQFGAGVGTSSGNGLFPNMSYDANEWVHYNKLARPTSFTDNNLYIRPKITEDTEEVDVYLKNVNLFDLTAMFGATIAEYIRTLEQGTAGAGVAWFRRYFPKPYYAYHAVGMEHVNATAAKTVGFNQWDEECQGGYWNVLTGVHVGSGSELCSKNFIPVIPNTTYFYYKADGQLLGDVVYYDADKNYITGATSGNRTFTTPSNCHYIQINLGYNYGTTYNHDICIYIHWDNSRDGDYEPYNLHTYPLADLTLRGIPKKDESGNLYFDGDRYLPDGTVERRYGIVDLGTLTWNTDTSEEWGRRFYSTGINTLAKATATNAVIGNIMCDKYTTIAAQYIFTAGTDKVVAVSDTGAVSVKDSAYTTTAAFKTAMSGVYLVYELATPTTEEADPYQYPMVVDNWGTEELVDGGVESGDRDVAIPVGHETKYPPNLKDKLESAANNPDADGAYILTHDGGSNTYTPLASNATIQNIIARLEALEGGGE